MEGYISRSAMLVPIVNTRFDTGSHRNTKSNNSTQIGRCRRQVAPATAHMAEIRTTQAASRGSADEVTNGIWLKE